MYTSFYNLDKKPFKNSPDPSFLWLGKKHKEAFSSLSSGIYENKGFLFLTGAAGTGKTILLKAFVKSLDKDVEWAVVADPVMERVDFYNALARGFDIDKPFTSKVQFLLQFSHFLHKANDENKKVLLLIDDCHLLSQEMLEDLRLLSNIEKADVKLINIFFVGQPGFNDMLLQPKNRAVQQRLTLRNELDSLDVDETDNYIRHRLKVAGTEEKLFSAKAVQAIHRFSAGIAGRINAICAQALVSGSAKAIQTIDNKIIEACVQQMDFPGILHQDSGDTFPGEKSTSKPVKKRPSASDFIQKNDNQYGWLKYGLKYGAGVCVLLIAGGYLWFRAPQYLDSGQEVSTEIADVVEVNTVSPVSSSPAVTMLEQYSSVIDEKKAAELKSAIPEIADSRNGPKEEDKALPAEEVLAEEAAPALGLQEQMEADVAKVEITAGPEVSGQQVDLEQDLGQEKDLLAENSAGDASVLQTEVPERVIVIPERPIELPVIEPPFVLPVSSSPAVTMLGPSTSVIDDKKATELKSAIPESTYSRNEPKEEDNDLPVGEVLAEEAAPAAGVAQQIEIDVAKIESIAEPEVSIQQVDLQQDLGQEKDLLSENSAGEASGLQIEVPERVIVEPPLERLEKPVVAVVAPVAPAATLAPLEPKKIILGLRPNSLKMTGAAQKELNSFVEKLKLYPEATVYVKGFVSSQSNTPENIKLSKDRALSVQKFMLDKGIEGERMEVVGMGNQEPIATNDTSEGRRKNRRVEVIVRGDGN